MGGEKVECMNDVERMGKLRAGENCSNKRINGWKNENNSQELMFATNFVNNVKVNSNSDKRSEKLRRRVHIDLLYQDGTINYRQLVS